MAGLGNYFEDSSASATTVPFDPPIPLLRGPLPAGLADDPSKGPFVLAFRNATAWRRAFEASKSKLREQCEAGARIGCSISASKNCKPPWWRALFRSTPTDFSEREQCEEREMAACLEASSLQCIEFAKNKCLPPFLDARIALTDWMQGSKFILSSAKDSEEKLAARNTKNHSVGSSQVALGNPCNYNLEVTNYRGSILFGRKISSGSSQDEDPCNVRFDQSKEP